jgi:hypothetical protein
MVRIVGGTGNYVKMHFRQDKHIRSYRQAHAKGDDRMKNKKSNQKVEGSKIASIIVLSALTFSWAWASAFTVSSIMSVFMY